MWSCLEKHWVIETYSFLSRQFNLHWRQIIAIKALKHVAQAFGAIVLASKRLPSLHEDVSGIRTESTSSAAIGNAACNVFLQKNYMLIWYYYQKKMGSSILIDLKMQYRFLTVVIMETSETEPADKGAARGLIQRTPKPTQHRNN